MNKTHNPPKFALGDVVWVNKSKSMCNMFMPCECKAIVMWYAEVSGMFMYSLLLKNSVREIFEECLWYDECDLKYLHRLPREKLIHVMDYCNDPSVAIEILSSPAIDAIDIEMCFENVFEQSKPTRKSKRSIEREIRGLMARIRRHDRLDSYGNVADCLRYMSFALFNWKKGLKTKADKFFYPTVDKS